MDCLGPNGKAEKYETFDVENMITPEQSSTATTQRSAPTASKTGRKCSLPLLLSLITLLISLLALVLSIYASVVARKGGSSTGSSSTAFLATSPRGLPAGYQAAHLFQGTGYFARLQPMLYPRSDHRAFPIGSGVYLLGGLTNALEVEASEGNATAARDAVRDPPVPLVLNATVLYNTFTESSSQQADMPEPRFRFCGAVLDGQLYVVGGMAAYEAPDAPRHVVSGSVLRYNPASNTWQTMKAKLAHPRSDCCAAAIGGKLVVAGGWSADYADTLGSVEAYDPGADAFSRMPNLTLARGDCEAAVIDDRYMVVLGGVGPDGAFTGSMEALDITAANLAWQSRASMNHPRGDFAAEALPGGRLIAMGGEASNGSATEFAMYEAEEYSWAQDEWVMKAPLPEARFRFDTAHVGERVYAFGGQPTCVSGLGSDGAKQSCVKVALDSVWGYFDVRYPDVYAAVKE